MSTTPTMTPDELLGMLYSRQGYVVLFSVDRCEIGQRLLDIGLTPIGGAVAPARIVGLSTRAEFDRQDELAQELCKVVPEDEYELHLREQELEDGYYYRVEAID